MEYIPEHIRKRPSAVEWKYLAEGELRYVRQLHSGLKVILDQELERGNLISEASGGWPDRNSIFVALSQPFHDRYEPKQGIEHEDTNDPHYWKEAYTSANPRHLLVCRFGN